LKEITPAGEKLKNIVFINQNSGYLMIDLINTHVEAGYCCTLIAGRIVERGNPLDPSVKVEKIIRYNRNSLVRRLVTWIWGMLQIVWIIKTKYRKSRLFIVSNPPFAPLLPLMVKNHYSILIFDIFPDALVDSGVISDNNIFARLWKKANKKVFAAAGRLYTISEGMGEVLKNYSGDKKIEVVPIWADNSFLKRIEPSDNPFIKRHNLQDKFIVMYSGNIGLSGQIEELVGLAANFTGNDIIFVFIGDGAKLKWLEQYASRANLKNVLILPWQPANELSCSLSSANLAVVGIDKNVSKLAMPSKLLSYLSVGSPVLCLAGEDTELAKFVKENNVGKAFDSSQTTQIINYIEWLRENPDQYKQISRNSSIAAGKFSSTNTKQFL
jgi:glycosyltransferase involved in cell wall biosynthesis